MRAMRSLKESGLTVFETIVVAVVVVVFIIVILPKIVDLVTR